MPPAHRVRPRSRRATVYGSYSGLHGHLQVEHFSGVVLEDLLLVFCRQPVDGLDRESGFVEPAAGPWIFHGADAWALGPAQTAIAADGLEQQLERVLRVEHRVVVEIPHRFREAHRARTPQRARLEPREL